MLVRSMKQKKKVVSRLATYLFGSIVLIYIRFDVNFEGLFQ